MTTATITIDPEFKALLRPLSDQVRQQLEENLKADGCLHPLIVWSEGGVLVDGHNRYEICERLGIKYYVDEMVFDDRDAVKLWMINNQLGKREVTHEDRDYYLGVKYRLMKKPANDGGKGTPKGTVGQNDQQSNDTTANKIAVEHGVSEKTVRRAAKAVEVVETQAVPEVQAAVTAGALPVRVAAKVAELPVEKQRAVAAAPEPKKAAKEAIAQAKPQPKPLPEPAVNLDHIFKPQDGGFNFSEEYFHVHREIRKIADRWPADRRKDLADILTELAKEVLL